ncbi:MAG: hypothetical protein JRF56_22750 [Deltaproteobacteria bacterium]|jgi:hypothetical protein|nr:hypothetical protein [Deltaproteobacteria bacterium]
MEKTILFGIPILAFIMWVPATSGRILFAQETPVERLQSLHPFEFNRKSIVVAENEPEAAASGSQTTNENKDQASEPGVEVKKNGSNNSKEAETKPLKPFKPSEEIAAEQAVDFPVDI